MDIMMIYLHNLMKPKRKSLIRCFYAPPPIDTPAVSIHGVGLQEWMSPCVVDRPQGTGDYLFMLFHDPVLISVDGRDRDFPSNTLMLWPCGAGHKYGNASQRFCHSWIHCDGTAVGRLLTKERTPVGKPIEGVPPAIVEKCLVDTHNELRQTPPDPAIALNILHTFLREIRRFVSRGARSGVKIPEKLLTSKWLIEMEFERKISLLSLAREASMSVPHFCAEFKRHFGVPPIEHLITQRMRQAAYLLGDMNLSVGEVASNVGYEDIYYFSRLFKRRMGLSPRAFRQKLRG